MNLNQIDFNKLKIIRDKYNRIDESGINHGRSIYYDEKNKLYYKLFHKDYIRRTNFELAIKLNFFDGLTPALTELITDNDMKQRV